MQLLKGRFARRYNQLDGRSGGLWQSRYHERTLLGDDALSNAIEYVHHNPVVAGLVEQPEKYAWSSANQRYATDLQEYLGSG
jgi:putative transposase